MDVNTSFGENVGKD